MEIGRSTQVVVMRTSTPTLPSKTSKYDQYALHFATTTVNGPIVGDHCKLIIHNADVLDQPEKCSAHLYAY